MKSVNNSYTNPRDAVVAVHEVREGDASLNNLNAIKKQRTLEVDDVLSQSEHIK